MAYQSKDPGILDSESDLVSRQIGLGATWELDFWGKYRRNIQANQGALLGNRAAYCDALVTLVASIANAFVYGKRTAAALQRAAASARRTTGLALVQYTVVALAALLGLAPDGNGRMDVSRRRFRSGGSGDRGLRLPVQARLPMFPLLSGRQVRSNLTALGCAWARSD